MVLVKFCKMDEENGADVVTTFSSTILDSVKWEIHNFYTFFHSRTGQLSQDFGPLKPDGLKFRFIIEVEDYSKKQIKFKAVRLQESSKASDSKALLNVEFSLYLNSPIVFGLNLDSEEEEQFTYEFTYGFPTQTTLIHICYIDVERKTTIQNKQKVIDVSSQSNCAIEEQDSPKTSPCTSFELVSPSNEEDKTEGEDTFSEMPSFLKEESFSRQGNDDDILCKYNNLMAPKDSIEPPPPYSTHDTSISFIKEDYVKSPFLDDNDQFSLKSFNDDDRSCPKTTDSVFLQSDDKFSLKDLDHFQTSTMKSVFDDVSDENSSQAFSEDEEDEEGKVFADSKNSWQGEGKKVLDYGNEEDQESTLEDQENEEVPQQTNYTMIGNKKTVTIESVPQIFQSVTNSQPSTLSNQVNETLKINEICEEKEELLSDEEEEEENFIVVDEQKELDRELPRFVVVSQHKQLPVLQRVFRQLRLKLRHHLQHVVQEYLKGNSQVMSCFSPQSKSPIKDLLSNFKIIVNEFEELEPTISDEDTVEYVDYLMKLNEWYTSRYSSPSQLKDYVFQEIRLHFLASTDCQKLQERLERIQSDWSKINNAACPLPDAEAKARHLRHELIQMEEEEMRELREKCGELLVPDFVDWKRLRSTYKQLFQQINSAFQSQKSSDHKDTEKLELLGKFLEEAKSKIESLDLMREEDKLAYVKRLHAEMKEMQSNVLRMDKEIGLMQREEFEKLKGTHSQLQNQFRVKSNRIFDSTANQKLDNLSKSINHFMSQYASQFDSLTASGLLDRRAELEGLLKDVNDAMNPLSCSSSLEQKYQESCSNIINLMKQIDQLLKPWYDFIEEHDNLDGDVKEINAYLNHIEKGIMAREVVNVLEKIERTKTSQLKKFHKRLNSTRDHLYGIKSAAMRKRSIELSTELGNKLEDLEARLDDAYLSVKALI